MKRLTLFASFLTCVVTASESDSLEKVSRKPFFGNNGLFTIVKREIESKTNRDALKRIKKPQPVESPLKEKVLNKERLPHVNGTSAKNTLKKVIIHPKVNKDKKTVKASKVIPSLSLNLQENKRTTIYYGLSSTYADIPRNEILMTILQKHAPELFDKIQQGEKTLEDIFYGRLVKDRNYFNGEGIFRIIWGRKDKKKLGCIVEYFETLKN